jgi:Neuraminidase (sialidase)
MADSLVKEDDDNKSATGAIWKDIRQMLDRDYPDPMPVPWPIDAHLFYSKDEGETWTLQEETAYKLADESKLVELGDGRLLISSRRWFYSPRGFNTATKGDDGIYHWDEQRVAETLVVNPCNGDIVSWKDGLLLHTYIKAEKERKGLTMAVSQDEGVTWNDIITLQDSFAAYSTMVVFKNGDVGVLYEDGSKSPDNGYDIVFSRIPRRLIRQSIKALQ